MTFNIPHKLFTKFYLTNFECICFLQIDTVFLIMYV